MPWAACGDCGALYRSPGGSCEACAARRRAHNDKARGTAASRGYGASWRRTSRRDREADSRCRACMLGEVWALRYGSWVVEAVPQDYRAAVLVDHVIPLDDGGADEWPGAPGDGLLLERYLEHAEQAIRAREVVLFGAPHTVIPRVNRQPLCRSCHGVKSALERRRTERG